MELPEEFKENMKFLPAEEYEAFMRSYDDPPALALRINTLKTHSAPQGCNERVAWCDTGRYYSGMTPGKSPLHEAGAYYIQEPSAMAVVTAADIREGERVLDMCAAPGGKTTHAACLTGKSGLIVANEIIPSRAKILAQNAERCGINNCIVTNTDTSTLAARMPAYFDTVIADVPCSGEGMFRKREIAVEEWSRENVSMCAKRSAQIIRNAAECVRAGGKLVYSTCTYERAENEDVVEAFLEENPHFSLIPTPLDGKEGIARGFNGTGYRLYPHLIKGEGHYVAVLKNNLTDENAVCGRYKLTADKTLGKIYDKWSAETLRVGVEYNNTVGDTLYYTPRDCPDLRGIKFLRCGLPLGNVEKGRFIPHHSLALALKPQEVLRVLDLPSDGAGCAAYLHGETLPCDLDDGWTLVTTDSVSLGWGKTTGGILKNFYPKGLRK